MDDRGRDRRNEPRGGSGRRSLLDWILVPFSDVRPGEGRAGFVLLASVFFLLVATYLLKPARDGLLATSGIPGLSDMELKAYSSLGQSLLLLGVVPLYARLAGRVDRSSLVTTVTLFFVANLAVFWCLQPNFLVARVPFLGIGFYLWFGVFNLLALAQFWSFAADFYDDAQGRRLLPAVAFGAIAGSVVGAWLASTLVRSGITSTYGLLLVGAAALLASLALLRAADARDPSSAAAPDERGWGEAGAFRLVLSHRFLLATALVVLLASWIKTNGDNLLYAIVQEVVSAEAVERGVGGSEALASFTGDQTTAFYGDFFFWVNAMALLLQGLVASRLLARAGFAALFLALPLFVVAAYPLLTVLPLLHLFRLAKIGEDAATHSLHNTALQVLWLPTTREMKYKGKAAVDTVPVRLGDGFAAGTTFVGVQVLLLRPSEFFALNAILAVAWLAAAIVVVRDRRRFAT